MFVVTPRALDKLKELKTSESDLLNISIEGGGCSGLSYQMKWQSYKWPYDKTIFTDLMSSIAVVTDNKSALFLEDIELDYEDGLNGKGFVWTNPKAKRVCGCGSSFST